jgi:lipoprotein-anchoring transpeptidase ErfK/SrfK
MKPADANSKRNKAQLFIAIVLLTMKAFAEDGAGRTERRVVVSIPDRQLAVIEDGKILRIFDVAVGASVSPSPIGEFHTTNRVTRPTYYHAGQIIPPGKDNPIGTRWIGLNLKGYGIHGTNIPTSIGKAASHGCIRLRNRDMEQLFEMLRPGDPVDIRAERDDETAELFGGEPVNIRTLAQSTLAGEGGQ